MFRDRTISASAASRRATSAPDHRPGTCPLRAVGGVRTDLRAVHDRLDRLDDRLRAVEIAFGKVDQRLLTIERIVLPASDPAD